MTGGNEPRGARVVGYLTNVYPAVSHSFIKREILALEARGLDVRRWSVRPFSRDLPDPSDRAEAERTDVLLDAPVAMLFVTLLTCLQHPLRFARAVRTSLAGRPAGARSLVARLAYVAEASLLLHRARASGVEHIHAHFGTNPASVARLVHVLGGPSFSFTVHGPDEFDQPIVHDLRGKISQASFTLAISQYGRSQLMRWSDPSDWSRLHVVRCGLDRSFLDAASTPITQGAVPTFSCVARLASQKGLPVLVDAAVRLNRSGRAFRIVVVGDGELRGEIEQRIVEEGIAHCFELTGWASSETVRNVIASSSAFVLPSFAEGLPVAIMEALALGRPVITTRIAGIPELVDAGCGWLLDAGDPDALATAMAEAIDAGPARLTALGREGARRVAERHNADHNALSLLGLLEAG